MNHIGRHITVGGRDLVVPKPTIGALRRFDQAFAAVRASVDGKAPDSTEALTYIAFGFVLETLQRNYPDMTRDMLEDWFDTDEITSIRDGIMESIGIKRKDPMPGEAECPKAIP